MSLRGASLRLGDRVFSGPALSALYRDPAYPLFRKADLAERRERPRHTTGQDRQMDPINYHSSAELYPTRRYAKSQQTKYRRFDQAADAIRYVIEEMPESWLNGSLLEVDEKRFEGKAIRALYDHDSYPYGRQVGSTDEAEPDVPRLSAVA